MIQGNILITKANNICTIPGFKPFFWVIQVSTRDLKYSLQIPSMEEFQQQILLPTK